MNDLLQKLESAIAETERIAREASGARWRQLDPEHYPLAVWSGDQPIAKFARLASDAAHAVHNDPQRVLRRVVRDRELLKLHFEICRQVGWLDEDGDEEGEELPVCGHCVPKHSWFKTRAEVPTYPCATVSIVAEDYGIEVES